jgi:lysophospholipase L1-like esterase
MIRTASASYQSISGAPQAGLYGSKVVTIGDSIMQANVEITSGGGSTAEPSHGGMRGFLSQFQAALNFPLSWRFQNWDGSVVGGSNFAVTGDAIVNVKGRLNSALKRDPDIVWVNLGTNDITSGLTAASILDGYRWIVRRCMDRGVNVWFNTILPRNNDGALDFTSGQNTTRLTVNTALRKFENEYKGSVIVFDADPVMMDPTTGKAYSAMFSDGVHPNATGAEAFALKSLLPKLGSFYRVQSIPRSIPADYNGTTSPIGNLLTNSDFSGTGGAISGTAISGTAPDSWTGTRTDGTSATGVFSIESKADWDGVSRNFVKMLISAAGAGVDNETIRINPTSTITTNVVAGQWYVCEVECIVDEVASGSNILRSVYAELRDNGTSGPISRFFNVGYTTGAIKEYLPTGAKRYILRTMPINSRTASGLILRLNADVDGTLTGSRAVYWGKPIVRPIDFVADNYGQDPQYVVAAAAGTTFVRGGQESVLILNPAGTIATHTVVMPPLPQNGDTVTITSSQAVTTLTLTSGKTVNGAATALTANVPVKYQFNATADRWFRV